MTKYIIFEMQTDKNGNVAFTPTVQKETEAEAWSAFYQMLSYAILSNVFSHTIMLCTNDGQVLDTRNYVHP